jgi:hypothetical protein
VALFAALFLVVLVPVLVVGRWINPPAHCDPPPAVPLAQAAARAGQPSADGTVVGVVEQQVIARAPRLGPAVYARSVVAATRWWGAAPPREQRREVTPLQAPLFPSGEILCEEATTDPAGTVRYLLLRQPAPARFTAADRVLLQSGKTAGPLSTQEAALLAATFGQPTRAPPGTLAILRASLGLWWPHLALVALIAAAVVAVVRGLRPSRRTPNTPKTSPGTP